MKIREADLWSVSNCQNAKKKHLSFLSWYSISRSTWHHCHCQSPCINQHEVWPHCDWIDIRARHHHPSPKSSAFGFPWWGEPYKPKGSKMLWLNHGSEPSCKDRQMASNGVWTSKRSCVLVASADNVSAHYGTIAFSVTLTTDLVATWRLWVRLCSSRPPWLSEALWLCLREREPHSMRFVILIFLEVTDQGWIHDFGPAMVKF